jgi:lipopolysaccharide export system ATP-binding protein
LSGGERRRVEIARALATDPKFILLDEPFTGIDPVTIEEIQSILFNLKSRNIGILITDHNISATLRITDRNYILIDGKIEAAGSGRDIVNNSRVRTHYLGEQFTTAMLHSQPDKVVGDALAIEAQEGRDLAHVAGLEGGEIPDPEAVQSDDGRVGPP